VNNEAPRKRPRTMTPSREQAKALRVLSTGGANATALKGGAASYGLRMIGVTNSTLRALLARGWATVRTDKEKEGLCPVELTPAGRERLDYCERSQLQ
jgi:hypothetical protein